MPKPLNLNPEAKSRLRKNVLEAIEDKKSAMKPVKTPAVLNVAPKVATAPVITPSAISAVKPIADKPVRKKSTIKKPAVKPIKIALAVEDLKIPATKIKPMVKITKAPVKKSVRKKIGASIQLPELSLDFKMSKQKIYCHWGVKIAVAVIIILLGIAAIGVFGIYKFGWNNAFTLQTAKILNLPAGSINGIKIGLADYLDDIKLLNIALSQNREGADGNLTGKNLPEKIFYRLVANALIEKKLKDYKTSVNRQELENKLKEIVSQIGDEKKAETATLELYGLNLKQFKEKILKPLLAKDILQGLITQDESLALNQKAKATATEALNLALRSEVDFKVLAMQYTEDEAGVNTGGDLGWITKGELSTEMENILFALAPGKISDQLVKNKIGYHILKVEERLTDEKTGQVSIHVRQILLKVDVDEYLKELMDQAKIKKYIK